ncbi:MAG: hypothetical protein DMF50_02580 [Acidobacteria bacterium]|nr:MAG: hypothetical protein DMF50_02580 [Acidobacteriota bacterium]
MGAVKAPPAARGARLALFEATSLTAKGVKDQLAARSFPVTSVRLFTSSTDPDANLTEFKGEAMLVTAPDEEGLGSLDIAFLCGGREEGARYLDWPRRKGFVAIDLTSAATDVDGVPLVNAGVNPEAISGRPGLIATPGPAAQMVSSLLAPVRRGPGLQEATVVVFQPASAAGAGGVEELYQQTVSLLNFHDLPRAVFGRQIAFNLVPSSLYRKNAVPGGSWPGRERDEVLRVTGGGFELSLEVVLAPVFHCHAVLARLVLPRGAGRAELLAAFDGNDQVRTERGGESVTPVERAGQEGIVLAGVNPAGGENAFWAWAVSDDLQTGTALNAVRIAEAILAKGVPRRDA